MSVVASELVFYQWPTLQVQGHSAKMSFYSGILYAKSFDCGVSQFREALFICNRALFHFQKADKKTSLRWHTCSFI
jgi:hypothetical protein